MGEGQQYDVVIIGGGLSGLTSGLYLQEAGLKVLILERATQAGGLTSSWQVHGQEDTDGKNFVLQHLKEEDIVLQHPMHMIFRDKYPNLIDVYKHLGILDTNLTEPLKEFNIIDTRLVKQSLKWKIAFFLPLSTLLKQWQGSKWESLTGYHFYLQVFLFYISGIASIVRNLRTHFGIWSPWRHF